MKIFLLIILSVFGFTQIYSQNMGVNTETPKATLHVEPTDKNSPTGADGIIIPRMADYPGNGVAKGQLIFLQNHTTDQDGFYFWDGTTWVWLINNYDRTIDKATYVASGTGYTGTGNNRIVNFSRIDAYDTTGFAVSNNEVTVGKTGKYLVTFTTSVKRTSTASSRQCNFLYSLYINGSQLPSNGGSVTVSTSNEAPSSTSAAMSIIVDLNQGDILHIEVDRSDEITQTFVGYGINGLTLTYLR